jgi:hypothetical protein
LLIWNATEHRGNKKLAVSDWNRHYSALVDYGRQNGHCNVPQCQSYECTLPGMGDDGGDYHYKGRLGIWLCTQRQSKKGMRSALAPEREELLQELVDQGILLWDVSHLSSILKSKHHGEEEWPIHYAALLKFRDEFGHANIQQTRSYECELTAADGVDVEGVYHYAFKLGFWLSRQRHAFRTGKLSADRIERLQELVDAGKFYIDR